ncbi:MAG: hypothetical protein AB7F59_12655 [Bdellovibrionales bacterium]
MTFADVTSQTLRPALNPYYQIVEDAQLWLNPYDVKEQSLLFTSLFNTVESPIISYSTNGTEKKTLIKRTSSLQLGGAWLINSKLQVGSDLGVSIVQPHNESSYSGFNDYHLMAKYSLIQKENSWGLSLAPEVYIPLPNNHPFISNKTTGFGGRLLFEKNFKHWAATVNTGYLRSPGATHESIDYSIQYPLAAGIRIPIGRRVALNLEGTTSLLPGMSPGDGPGDIYVGSRIAIFRGGILSIGGSYGEIEPGNNASIRALVGLDVLPYAKELTRVISLERLKQIQTTRDCSPRPRTIQLQGRALTNQEKKSLTNFPFITKNGRFKKRDPGRSMKINTDGVPYVENSQILFAIDLSDLPQRFDVISLDSLLLNVKVHRHIKSHDHRAGMLCLVGQKICSGDFPTDFISQEHINPKFFEGKEPPNDFFMHRLAEASHKTQSGEIEIAELALPLQKLLENSLSPDPFTLIYDSLGESLSTLYFAVAHDIYIARDIQLQISMTVESCVTSNQESTSEPQVVEEQDVH